MDANELVTVYTVNDPLKAELIRAELETEGIRCEIGGEKQAGFSGVFGIDLLVRAIDADRARKFIEQHESSESSEA